jgi:hypothetical protein
MNSLNWPMDFDVADDDDYTEDQLLAAHNANNATFWDRILGDVVYSVDNNPKGIPVHSSSVH